MRLPNFLIVGAAKSGTTSLFHYLRQHPEGYMPTFKEPQYLVCSKLKHRVFKSVSSFSEYRELFSDVNHELAIGEASVFYLYYYTEAIKNIKKTLGEDVKIIIVLRNPVERAFSAYRHVSRNSLAEILSFENALKEESGRLDRNPSITPMVMYKDMSLYNDAVQAYKSAFKDVHIILHEDLKNNLSTTMKNIFRFLEINQEVEVNFVSQHNVGAWDWRSTWLKNVLFGKSRWKSILKFFIPKNVLQRMGSFIRTIGGQKAVQIVPETKTELQAYFRDDIVSLAKTIDKDLKNWIDAT